MSDDPTARPPMHTAIFRQPGAELNPLGAKVPTPIHVEVFQIFAGKLQRPIGWTAREATTRTEFKRHVGTQPGPYQARYRVAQLFTQQTGPWIVYGEEEADASGFHLHYELDQPSLCGSRFHQSFREFDLALHLPELRAVRTVLAPAHWKKLCKKCLELVDRTPAPGDRVRVRVSGRLGEVIRETKAAKVEHYVLRYDTPAPATDPGKWTASELSLVMFETQPQT
jgi:hypothetical protein